MQFGGLTLQGYISPGMLFSCGDLDPLPRAQRRKYNFADPRVLYGGDEVLSVSIEPIKHGVNQS
jgi:hypothetical protein